MFGIDGSLNPRNMRRVEVIGISSAYLRETDMEALSKFDFFNLRILTLMVSQIESCDFFKELIKLSQDRMQVEIKI